MNGVEVGVVILGILVLIIVVYFWKPILVVGVIAGLFAIGPIGWAILLILFLSR